MTILPNEQGDPRATLPPESLDAARYNGFPVVASQLARKDRAGLVMGAGVALMLGGVTLLGLSYNRTPRAPAPTAPVPAAATPAVTQVAPVTIAQPKPVVAAAALPAAVPPKPNAGVALPAARAVATTGLIDRGRAPALVFDNSPGGSVAPAAAPAGAAGDAAKPKPPPAGLTAEEQFAQRISGEGEQVATRMASPSTTVAEGTLIPGVLETALDTDTPGYARAIISRDVRSFDGSRVLIPRSSRVIGQYKSGLAVGQTRAYIVWTRLIRPDGVSIALGSPATDSSGRNGLGGKVDSHFGKRFGAAILLSVIGAAGQAIGGGTSVILSGPQAAATSSAQNNINIPPTIRVSQGQPINIFTAHDLDFSGVADAK